MDRYLSVGGMNVGREEKTVWYVWQVLVNTYSDFPMVIIYTAVKKVTV